MLSTTKRGNQHQVRPHSVRKFFQTQLEALKEIRRAWGMNLEQILTKQAIATPEAQRNPQ
jgi:hypothetical protein